MKTIEVFPTYPEGMGDAIRRYKKTLIRILERDKNDAAVIVTHGYGVQIICEEMGIPDFLGVDYCESFIFRKEYNGNFVYDKNIKPNI
jgi:hypothetical protein